VSAATFPATGPISVENEERQASVWRGIRRARTTLQRRYDTTADVIWIAGRHALSLSGTGPFPDGPVSIHLRHPQWIEPALFVYWFDGLDVDVAWADRTVPAPRTPETRRGDERRFARRLLHALSIASDDRNADVIDAVPILTPAQVVLAELWRTSLLADAPMEPRAVRARLAASGHTLMAAMHEASTAPRLRQAVSDQGLRRVATRREDDDARVLLARVVERSVAQVRSALAHGGVVPGPGGDVLDEIVDAFNGSYVVG